VADANVFITVAYQGAGFHGFARQPGLATVQGSLEDALALLAKQPVETVGAGRTDAGVHALGQVVSFTVPEEPASDLRRLARSLDALTPPQVSVVGARLARPGADARHSATARRYRYRVSAGGPVPVLSRSLVWRRSRRLDLETMRVAGQALIGEHDFRSFCVTPSAKGRRTVRSIDRVDVLAEEVAGEPVVAIVVEGHSFLHSMVRIIVGTLVEVGEGKRPPQAVAQTLDACERASAGETAPALGLVLESVSYPPDIWI
jgi:tRNA pseudouridine38-40 synthase